MTVFWILGGIGLLVLIEKKCLDVARSRGYQDGFAAGVEQSRGDLRRLSDKAFQNGYRAADNWWIAAEDGVEVAERRKEIGA